MESQISVKNWYFELQNRYFRFSVCYRQKDIDVHTIRKRSGRWSWFPFQRTRVRQRELVSTEPCSIPNGDGLEEGEEDPVGEGFRRNGFRHHIEGFEIHQGIPEHRHLQQPRASTTAAKTGWVGQLWLGVIHRFHHQEIQRLHRW